jgi:hypothetical protein
MRRFRLANWMTASLLTLAASTPLRAGWDNVFQVTCNSCGSRPAQSYYTPVSDPCPQNCTTRYVQRCYYQPVTTYETRTYNETVTTYRTSYYWEPVTSYRYTSYYDPSSCSYRQQACPTTCYRLRSQCCPVQSVVARYCTVPVQSQRLVTYYEPQTTCCHTTIGAPVAAPPPGASVIDSQTGAPPAGVRDSSDTIKPSDSYKPNPEMPPASSSRQLQPRSPNAKAPSAETDPPPKVRLDKIVSLPKD